MKRLLTMAVALVAVATMGLAQGTPAAAPATGAAPAAPAAVAVEESPDTGLSLSATADIYSAYVWRGCVINDRPVWQPGGTAAYDTGDYGSFSANVWGNFDITDRNNHRSGGGLNEIDYTASYAIDVGPMSLSAGHIWYTFPKVNGKDYFGSTREVYATAAYNNDIVTPFLKAYYDYEAAEGFYGNAGLTKSIELSDQFSVGAEVSLGAGDSDYMDCYFASDDSGLADFNAAVFCSYALTDSVSVGARVAWMSLIDSDARDNEVYWDEDLLWGGVNLAASF